MNPDPGSDVREGAAGWGAPLLPGQPHPNMRAGVSDPPQVDHHGGLRTFPAAENLPARAQLLLEVIVAFAP